MYITSPVTAWQWAKAVPGHLPEQAVMFWNNSDGVTVYVATAVVIGEFGVFTSNGSCTDFFEVCKEKFNFLVLIYGKFTTTLYVINYYLINSHKNANCFVCLETCLSGDWYCGC